MQKPFPSYYGGKEFEGGYQAIINHIRPHDVFIEICAGNATVTRYIKPALRNILNDIDKNTYQALCEAFKHNAEVFNTCFRDFPYNDFLGYRVAIYFDPPYLLDSRKSNRKVYKHEMTTEDHIDLLCIAKTLPSNFDVLISHYPHELYENALQGWKVHEYTAKTRKGVATELLFMNYHEINELHDFRYLGVDFIDRQRMKRKATKIIEKLKGLPVLERNKILSDIHNHFSAV